MKSIRTRCHRSAILWAAVAALAGAGSTRATTIGLSFDTSNFPSYDPDGSKLVSIANAAKTYWLGLLPESGHDYSVTVHYSNLSAGQLGLYNNFDHTLSIDFDSTWFIDPNPANSNQYQPFNQVLYRDLPPGADKSSLHGSIPKLLEVGYQAPAIPNSAAAAGYDMYSTMLHEMGHFLEIGYNLLKPSVDLQPQFLGDQTGCSADRANESHLVMSTSLMDPTDPMGLRTLPSALDLIVAAHEQNHSEIALKRVDWFGDVNMPLNKFWFWSPGWEGGQEPSSNTEVTVRDQTTSPSSAKLGSRGCSPSPRTAT